MARKIDKDVTDAAYTEEPRERVVYTRVDAFATQPDDFRPALLEDNIGGSYRGKPIYDQDRVIDQIDSGRTLGTPNGVITYSFLDGPTTIGRYNNPNEGFREPDGYSPMSEAEKAVARYGMILWDDLIAPSIVEKNGNGADILYANTTTGPAQAWAYYPGGNGYKYTSDVWTADPSVNWTNQWLDYNGYGWTTIVHEQGHALGLSHPGNYNFSPNFSQNYASGAEYAQDSRQYSIMSYWPSSETGAATVDVAVGLVNYPQTPMIHDILTIQEKYGADLTTRATDTTYGFNSNAGREIYDFSKNTAPNLAIYDAGGNDTLDLSGANAGVFLDLRAGSFSSAAVRPTLESANAATERFNAATDAAQGDFALWTAASLDAYLDSSGVNRSINIYNVTGVTGVMALSYSNVSIAYNTVIENAAGGAMRDYLIGNQVDNVLSGNGGDDILSGLLGNDTLDGGDGQDSVSYASATAGVTVSLADGGPHVTVEGSDTFVSIEGLIGSDYNDVLTGDAGDNIINGLRGSDVLDGGAGNDILSFMGAAAVNFTLSESGSGTVANTYSFPTGFGGAPSTVTSTDTYTSFEGVAGTAFNDSITGNSIANVLKGDLGNDTLNGAGGDDALYGEVGDDSLLGGEGNDKLYGGLGNDQLQGQAGNDLLFGEKGNDLLLGGLGDDLIDGGEGNDTANYQLSATGVVASLVTNTATGEGNDTFVSIENLTGSDLADSLTGDGNANLLSGRGGDDVLLGLGGNDTLSGGAGNDTLNGGEGNDTASFGTVAVTVNLMTGTATGDGNDTLVSIENVTGSSLNDTITGDDNANVLSGSAGNDTLAGNGGDDTLSGGTGNDSLNGGIGIDTASYAASATAVSVNLATGTATGEGSDTLTGIENVTGSALGDSLTGDAGDNVLSGGAGDDVLDGGKGNDRLDGGAGTDIVSYAAAAVGVSVTLGLATPYVTGEGSDTFVSIEGVIGSAFNDTLTGDAGANILSGGAGNDTLNGGLGNDTLSGGLGNDTMVGGIGIDTASYAAAAAGVTANLATGTATGEGNDTLATIENLIGSGFADTLTGDGFANSLTGGAGNDTLNGGAGNDTLTGGTGDDVLNGGDGIDTANYGSSLTAVAVNLFLGTATGEGNDSLSGIENVVGSGGNDTLIGDANGNVLNGGGGNDILTGGGGVDDLIGGGGNDIFRIDSVSNGDRVTDFALGDLIDLSLLDANSTALGDQAFAFIADDAFSNVAGQLRYDGNALYGDTNGDGTADFALIISNHYTLQSTDLVL